MVGAIVDKKTREDLLTRLTVPNMIPELHKISAAAISVDEYEGAEVVEDQYRHSFLVGLDRNKYGVVKMEVPPQIAKALFYTGVDVAKKPETDTGDVV